MGNYIIIQIIASVFLIFAILKVFFQYRTDKISMKRLILWCFLWLGVGIIFWLPQTTSFVASVLGIGRGADLVIYTGMVILYYLIFRIYVKIDKQQEEITKIVQTLAIKESKNDNTKTND